MTFFSAHRGLAPFPFSSRARGGFDGGLGSQQPFYAAYRDPMNDSYLVSSFDTSGALRWTRDYETTPISTLYPANGHVLVRRHFNAETPGIALVHRTTGNDVWNYDDLEEEIAAACVDGDTSTVLVLWRFWSEGEWEEGTQRGGDLGYVRIAQNGDEDDFAGLVTFDQQEVVSFSIYAMDPSPFRLSADQGVLYASVAAERWFPVVPEDLDGDWDYEPGLWLLGWSLATGNLLWWVKLPDSLIGSGGVEQLPQIATAPDRDDIYVAYPVVVSGMEKYVWLAKYSFPTTPAAAPELVWRVSPVEDFDLNNEVKGIAATATGVFFACNSAPSNEDPEQVYFFVARHHPDDGEVVWRNGFQTSSIARYSLAADGQTVLIARLSGISS